MFHAGVAGTAAFTGSWKGIYSTRGYFRTETTAAYLCGAETVSLNASFDFEGSGPLNISMPLDVSYPGESPGFMNQLVAGEFDALFTTSLGGLSDPTTFGSTALMRTVKVNETLVRNRDTGSSSMCVLFARDDLPGNFQRIHYVEAAGIALGSTVWPCPAFTTSATCVTNFLMTNVATLYEDVASWHTEPWSACNTTTLQRTRTVSCRGRYGKLQNSGKCGSVPVPSSSVSCTPGAAVAVPEGLEGSWVAVMQVSEAMSSPGQALLPLSATRQAVVVIAIEISSAGSAAAALAAAAAGIAAPSASDASVVFSHSPRLFADPAREDAMEGAIKTLAAEYVATGLVKQRLVDLNSTEGLSVTPRAFSARIHAVGSNVSGVIEGHTATSAEAEAAGSGMPFALAYEAGAATAGATSGMAAGANSLSVVISPQLASSASAFPVMKRRAHAAATSDALARAATMPATSVLTGIATQGPTRYDVQPYGQCIFDVSQNRCERRRPISNCVNRLNETVDQAFCAELQPPQGAGELPCSGCRRWDVSVWGSCSAACSGGTFSRSVVCRDSNNATTSDLDCISLLGPKPVTTGTCNTQPCADFRVGPWSDCSSACGDGRQTRTVDCVDVTGVVPEQRCQREAVLFPTKPNTTQSCFKCNCESSTLQFSPFVRLPDAFATATDSSERWNTSRGGAWTPITAATFCPAGQELLTVSQWRCHTRAVQSSMCTVINQAAGARLLPFAFRAEPGSSLAAPAFLPRPAPGSPPLDVRRVRADSGCSFLDFDFPQSAFADASRQGAVGACRAIA